MNIKVMIIDRLWQLYLVMNRTTNKSEVRSAYRGQGKVLNILKDSSEITRAELGERVDIGRQSLSALLLKLEKSGYILREVDPADRRRLIIRLTEKGRTAANAADKRTSPLPSLLECLNEQELLMFNDCLERILNHQRQTYPDLSPDPIETNPGSSFCTHCTGPETCTHDYLKYGHSSPNPNYCKYSHLFKAKENTEDKN